MKLPFWLPATCLTISLGATVVASLVPSWELVFFNGTMAAYWTWYIRRAY